MADATPVLHERDRSTLAAHVASPPAVFMALAGLALVGILIVFFLGRARPPMYAAMGALFLQVTLCLFLAVLHQDRPTGWRRLAQCVALVALGLLSGVCAYFFGPNSGFAALIALVLIVNGVLSGYAAIPLPSLAAWLTYASLALGQLGALSAVALGWLPDLSLKPVLLAHQPVWYHVAGHGWLQMVYLGAFLAGRAFQRRYLTLARQVDQAARSAARREALLEEARAEYRRALAAGRRAVFAGPDPRDDTPSHGPPAPGETAATVRERLPTDTIRDPLPPIEVLDQVETVLATVPPTVISERTGGLTPASGPGRDGRSYQPGAAPEFPVPTDESEAGRAPLIPLAPEAAWQDAHQSKLQAFYLGITGCCVSGAALLGLLAVHRGPLYLALACITGIVAATWLHRWITLERPVHASWPWLIMGLLSAGPAYSIGLHSAFGALMVAWLFAGPLFHEPDRVGWLDRGGTSLLGILVGHSVIFVLVLTGVLGDLGNVPMRQAGAPTWAIVLDHVLLMSLYCAALKGGLAVDRRYESLTVRAEAAAREAARQEALLATARAELERVLAVDSSGIFSGVRVGRYELGRMLGRGGMGEVYAATEVESGHRVALKLVRADRVHQARHLQLLFKEADALRRVRSEYVARILEVAGIEREMPYIVTEYIEGRSLAELLLERSSLPLEEVRALVCHVAKGLHDVHAAGVVHCDLKPHNVINTASDRAPWKLVDFGIATTLDARNLDTIMGTPQYMSPEQAQGERVDARSDLYSLCLVAYRALAGRPAFFGYSPRAVARAMLAGGPPDPRGYVDLPEDVALALRIGLAQRPEDRFASARELTQAFEAAFDGRLGPHYCRRARRLLRARPWT